MIKKIVLLFIFISLAFSCNEAIEDANSIINKSIEVSGGELFKRSNISFDFRDKHYKAIRYDGKFRYERVFKDSLGVIKDVLSNKGFERYMNSKPVNVMDSMVPRYTASVNSVHYFSVLPFSLNDKAVNKTYLNQVEIKGKDYFKIKVTFNQDGGGEDYDDEFIYWINAENYKTDYLAYSYNEKDGKGFRFREAYNERYVNGIRFVDYNNYKPKSSLAVLDNLDVLYKKGDLVLLSKIDLKNISVSKDINQ